MWIFTIWQVILQKCPEPQTGQTPLPAVGDENTWDTPKSGLLCPLSQGRFAAPVRPCICPTNPSCQRLPVPNGLHSQTGTLFGGFVCV